MAAQQIGSRSKAGDGPSRNQGACGRRLPRVFCSLAHASPGSKGRSAFGASQRYDRTRRCRCGHVVSVEGDKTTVRFDDDDAQEAVATTKVLLNRFLVEPCNPPIPPSGPPSFSCAQVHDANPRHMDGVEDMTELTHLHDQALVHNIRYRFQWWTPPRQFALAATPVPRKSPLAYLAVGCAHCTLRHRQDIVLHVRRPPSDCGEPVPALAHLWIGSAPASAPGLGSLLPRSASGLGSPLPHLHWDWAPPRGHVCTGTGLTPGHICIGTGLAPDTSALGLGSPLPQLHRDWAHPLHMHGTGLTAATSALTAALGLDSPLPHLHRDLTLSLPHLRHWARPCHICTGHGSAKSLPCRQRRAQCGVVANTVHGLVWSFAQWKPEVDQ